VRKNIAITILLVCFLNYHSFAQADLVLASDAFTKLQLQKDSADKALQDSLSANVLKDTLPSFKGKVIYGIASFYSKNLEGSKTSTGEHFHHKMMTAASNNFPLNTWVRVTNLRNDKSVIVRINDHMAVRMYKKGRVVDLSHSAAAQLDFILLGVIKVKVEEVPEGTPE
jgi:rare lipoprotein A